MVSAIAGDVMRFREVSGPSAKAGSIEVHIIRPGWGSSGYYSEDKLKKACESGVYPAGMLMHWNHPTRQQEEDQPARVTGTIAAVLAEQGYYLEEGDPAAWDGPGVYALAEVRPKFTEDLKWLAGKIGVSHYVEGEAKEGVAPDGKKGPIITELKPSPFNSVDFVTIPGAGGHSKFNEVLQREASATGSMEDIRDKLHQAIRVKFGTPGEGMEKYGTWIIASYPDHCVFEAPDGVNYDVPYSIEEDGSVTLGDPKPVEITYQPKESRMTGKQLSIRLSEIMTSDPEVIAEIRKQVAEELQIESQTEAQKKKLTEAETRIKTLETENKDLKAKIAEKAAREFVTTEVGKANLPESVGKVLTESLVKQVVLTEDGSIDSVEFGLVVSEAIKAKQAEVADILRESGVSRIHDNGPISPPGNPADVKKAREEYRDTLVENGMSTQQANRLAGIEVKA